MVKRPMKSVYIETSIASYMTARPSRDVRVAAWQQITAQWWTQDRSLFELYTSELVIAEASEGNPEAAQRRLDLLNELPKLVVDAAVERLAVQLIDDGGFPAAAKADALHVAAAAIHAMDYMLTWNCRHINNAVTKPIIRSICTASGYTCPEICTPQELLLEEDDNVSG